jgi:hypothetical protein
MHRTRLLPALALTAVAALAAGPALAANPPNSDPNAKAKFVGKIHAGKKSAKFKVTYNCASGEALWVSAKQAKSGKKDKALEKEGSSAKSAAWWESHRNKFTCDGQPHTASFTIDKVEKGSKGTLKAGTAFVQFCVSEGKDSIVLYKTGWVGVE